jgi:PST family polysaccharide transporter
MTWAYKTSAIAPLLLILAVGSFLISITTVPAARIQASMRFQLLSILGMGQAVFMGFLSIVLAILHFGASSLIFPIVIAAALRAPIYWVYGPVNVRLDPQFKRWRYLLEDVSWLSVAMLLLCLVAQGDYLILGFRQSKAAVGYYFVAFSLATQVSAVVGSVAQVVQPALCQLVAMSSQQMKAFVRAAKMLAVFCALVCLLQVVLADSIVRLLFSSRDDLGKWYPAVPAFQALSVGTSVWAIGAIGMTLLCAQRAFRLLAIIAAVHTTLFLTGVAIAAQHGATAVAQVVAAVSILMGWVMLDVPIRQAGGTWRDIAGCALWPQLLAALAVIPASWLGSRFPATRIGDATRVVVVSATAVAIYLPLVRATMGGTWQEGLTISKSFLQRFGAQRR